MRPATLDIEGLVKAFADPERREREYILDTQAGTVHFVPVNYLRLAEDGKLDPEKLTGQAKERAQVAQQFLDDLTGRYELVPYVEPGAEDEWLAEFLAERKAGKLTDELNFDWKVFRAKRLREEVESWLDQTDMFGDDADADDEAWDEDGD